MTRLGFLGNLARAFKFLMAAMLPFEVRLQMKKIGWLYRLFRQQPTNARTYSIAGCLGVAMMMVAAGAAFAQDKSPGTPLPSPAAEMSIPEGYTAHHSVDLGGRMSGISGSQAMYDTMVNLHSGPRILGETFEMHGLPGAKHPYADSVSAFGSGFGGDPYNFARLSISKGKAYEFSGMFRRDRQYFDYDLLGNPNIVPNTIPIGPNKAPTGTIAWGGISQSPVLFNTVRRMTDTALTIAPLSLVTYRLAYSHNTFEGPTLSPTYNVAKYDALLSEYQRNSTDDFIAAIEWKPVTGTRLTFEGQATHYKADSFFTLNPNSFQAQEADGTPVYLGNWDSQVPYGIAGCNTSSMGSAFTNSTTYTIFSTPQTPGGLPVINPACSVVTSYMRSQPTRITTPTGIVRLQSSTIKNVTLNGDFRYTVGTMKLPSYTESVLGLDGPVRSISYKGYAQAHRAVVAADFGFIWQATTAFSLSDQVDFSTVQQPGYSNLPIASTLSTPAAPNQTITYSGPLVSGNAVALPHGINGFLTNNYFGQEFLTNYLTGTWDPTPRTTLSLTYRYGDHKIGQGVPHKGPIPLALADPVNGSVAITENGGIFHAAIRPVNSWDINGSVEIAYADNAFTAVSPRQLMHYQVHTKYKPAGWATISAAFNDRERHNNTNNNQAAVANGDAEYYGPLNHVDRSRVASFGAVLAPNEHTSVDLNYSYNDVYTATNICFTSGATATLPGAATLTSGGTPNVCPGIFARGSTQLVDFFARDFIDAPTQYGSAALNMQPQDNVRASIGYRASSVNGTRFYNDARDVAGSLVSLYQSPFATIAWTVHPGLIIKTEYNYFGYGEGGASGAPLCSTAVSVTATVVPCSSSSLPGPTGLREPPSGLTAARPFRANNLVLGVHYEF